jgi:hypothetical protein
MSYPINTQIPNGPNDPADDQNLIRQNFGNIANYLAVDHVAAGAIDNGYHTVVHSVPFSTGTDPSAIPGIGQIYTKTVGSPSDQQLFYESGLGTVTQLTGGATTASGTGSTTLPGGIIFKWGWVAIPSSGSAPLSGTVTFAAAFTNNLFNVQMTLQTNFGTSNDSVMGVQAPTNAGPSAPTLSKTSFVWNFSGSGNAYNGFYWFAVGN